MNCKLQMACRHREERSDEAIQNIALPVPDFARLIRTRVKAAAEDNMPDHPEAIIAGKKRPFTGTEFLESLRDGREVYIYGERVGDVTTHPAFRNSAASVALLYDALHDEAHKEVLTASTDTGSGGYTHKFFKAAHSREEVIAQRDAIAAWARLSYGWMGRSPDYKAAFLNTLGANAGFYGNSPTMRGPGTSARRKPCSNST